QEFPQSKERGTRASEQVSELLKLRTMIGQAIEKARQEKLIGNALEAAGVFRSKSEETTKNDKTQMEEIFILNYLTIEQAGKAGATVAKTPYQKCARCWRYREYVGTSKTHPDLCDRCEAVVNSK